MEKKKEKHENLSNRIWPKCIIDNTMCIINNNNLNMCEELTSCLAITRCV